MYDVSFFDAYPFITCFLLYNISCYVVFFNLLVKIQIVWTDVKFLTLLLIFYSSISYEQLHSNNLLVRFFLMRNGKFFPILLLFLFLYLHKYRLLYFESKNVYQFYVNGSSFSITDSNTFAHRFVNLIYVFVQSLFAKLHASNSKPL